MNIGRLPVLLGYIFLACGATVCVVLFIFMLISLGDQIETWWTHEKYKRKYKHRFDKTPTAECYCHDCKYWQKQSNRCSYFSIGTADDWFCSKAEARKTDPNSQ